MHLRAFLGVGGGDRSAGEPIGSVVRIPKRDVLRHARPDCPPDSRDASVNHDHSRGGPQGGSADWWVDIWRGDMKRERFDLIAEPAPRMSEAALAEIDALRASDRLQRIFDNDFKGARRSQSSVRRDAAPPPPLAEVAEKASGETKGGGRRGFSSSGQRWVLVGVVPACVVAAVLAVEGISALRSGPEPVAVVVAGSEPGLSGKAREAGTAEAGSVAPAPAPSRTLDRGMPARVLVRQERSVAGAPAVPAASVTAERPTGPGAAKASGDLVKTIESRPGEKGPVESRLAESRPLIARDAGPAEPVAGRVAEPAGLAAVMVEPAERVAVAADPAEPVVVMPQPIEPAVAVAAARPADRAASAIGPAAPGIRRAAEPAGPAAGAAAPAELAMVTTEPAGRTAVAAGLAGAFSAVAEPARPAARLAMPAAPAPGAAEPARPAAGAAIPAELAAVRLEPAEGISAAAGQTGPSYAAVEPARLAARRVAMPAAPALGAAEPARHAGGAGIAELAAVAAEPAEGAPAAAERGAPGPEARQTGPAAWRVAEPAKPAPGAAEPARPLGAEAEPAAFGTGTGTVPQATWSPRAAPPVPVPAPRISEVLAQAGARTDGATVAQPRAAGGRAAEEAVTLSQPQVASAPPRIVVHYHEGANAPTARRVAAELLARGFDRTELRPVSFAISRANVRYFHDQNRAVAREVNALLRSTGRRSELRDFTHFAPLPSVGTVEVWLPG